MIELLFLLLPLAAATGWYSGRQAQPGKGRGCDLDVAYYEGLNLLLNEQPDKAVDHFIEMLGVDSETVETHLALGGLFRRRGEVDRAIRIHQNLIARPSLSREQRAQALLELGRDYLKAGLYDRAIGLFDEVLEQDVYPLQALRHLHQIHQRVRDWQKALATAVRLESLGEPSLRMQRGHYCCELAQQALAANDEFQAEQWLQKAMSTDKQSVRASIMLGDLARQRGRQAEAIRYYSTVESQNAAFLGEVLEPLVSCCRASGDLALLEASLQRAVEHFGNFEALVMLSEHLRKTRGVTEARSLVDRFLERHPSPQVLQQLLRLHDVDDDSRKVLQRMQQALDRLVGQQYLYHCSHCGFSGRQLHWQCPGCNDWGVLQPLTSHQSLAGERPEGLLIDQI
jgi:lipopolysaccharide biosynthesis regulator YciM